ncbi:MAG: YggT family protein [Methylobacteriaceae bacterium]|nr:YggT family protein [Methylobacteriaceae bacterium]
MRALLDVVLILLDLYTYVVIAGVILSWLLAFNVVNYGNPFVRSVWQAVSALTEPLLGPIRARLPNLGGVDVSPVVLLLGVFLFRRIIELYIYPNVF